MAHAFEKMIRYVRQHDDLVWHASRDEIADHVPGPFQAQAMRGFPCGR